MYAGRYADARECLSKWSATGEERDRLGLLRLEMLDEIESRLGLDEQERQSLSQIVDGIDGTEAVRLLKSTDALDPRLWMRLVSFEEPGTSFRPALIAAMMIETDSDLWVHLVMLAASAEVDRTLMKSVLAQARFFCGDEFYDHLWAESDVQEQEGRELLRHLATDAYRDAAWEMPTTIRWVNVAGSSAEDWIVERFEL